MSGRPARRRDWYLVAAVVASVACCLAPATAGASARPAGTGAVFNGFLNDVSCAAAADCWAFGHDNAQQTVAEHWNGHAWAIVPVAGPPGTRSTYLPSVSCVSGTDCWAAGQYQNSQGRMLAFAEHWDGTAWKPVAVPVPAGSPFSLLNAVSCDSASPDPTTPPKAADCWATEVGPFPGSMVHWNGHAWADVHTPGLGSQANPERVSCVSATDCWLSGMHGNASTGGTLIGHWAGKAWTAVPTPTSHVPADSLLGISCQATGCMTVGMHNNTRPLAQRWNGTAWSVTPTGTARAVLYAVSCVNPGNCIATGGTNGGNGRVFTERWRGSGWHEVPAPSPRGGNSSLVGVSCVSANPYSTTPRSASSDPTTPRSASSDPTTPRSASSDPTTPPKAADCWGVGSYFNGTTDRSLIEHWNGTAWSIVA